VVCVVGGQPLAGYAAADWVRIAAITVFGQLIGHSLFNLVLRSISPTIVSLCSLFTVPLAAIIAAVALSETPPAAAVPAMILLVAGTALVINARARASAASA
jgi:drug/metabolite transporter (DMT)-like permease